MCLSVSALPVREEECYEETKNKDKTQRQHDTTVCYDKKKKKVLGVGRKKSGQD